MGHSDRSHVHPKGQLLTNHLLSFAEKIIKAVKGEKGIVEPTYIYLPGVSGGEAIAKETGVDYFSVPVELGVSLRQFNMIRCMTNPYSRPAQNMPITHLDR